VIPHIILPGKGLAILLNICLPETFVVQNKKNVHGNHPEDASVEIWWEWDPARLICHVILMDGCIPLSSNKLVITFAVISECETYCRIPAADGYRPFGASSCGLSSMAIPPNSYQNSQNLVSLNRP
jgi:hypothetical protein